MSNIINPNLETLRKLAQNKKIPHAIIIETNNQDITYNNLNSIIKIFMCNSQNSPCNICNTCKKIDNNIHPDVNIIFLNKNESFIKIDKIRYMKQDIYVKPNENEYKIYIIKSSDYLTHQAQNAFMKILEEPPEYIKFILICESASNLLETIRSRCEFFTDYTNQEDINTEILNISNNIFEFSLKKNKFEVLKIISQIPNNRAYFKKILENLLINFMSIFKNKEKSINYNKYLIIIDDIYYMLKIIDKNINLNLLINYLLIIL